MDQRSRSFLGTAALGVALALTPFPGRWAILQQVLPVFLVMLFYWQSGYTLGRAGLARPPQGWVRCLGQDNGALRLEVEDDGMGCAGTNLMKGTGLRIMALRAELIGADLEILTPPEGGTTVSCRVGFD